MINASTQNQSASLINFRLSVVAGILGCLIAALFAVLLPTADTYADTNKCRTMIYRSDTAGYDSPYVQVCADVNDNGEITGNISLSENKRSFLGVAVEKYNGGNGIAENIRVCQRTWLDGCESGSIKFYYAGNGPSSDNVYTGLTNFNDFTDKVLYNVSNIAGYEKSETVDEVLSDGAVTQETITYRYNGIYDGSYADWQNAGSPDQNGNTDNDENTEETTEETEDSSDTSKTDPCYNASESLGWIVCPLMNWVSSALSELYSDIVEPFLQVDSDVFKQFNDQGEAVGTYKAWSIFRDMANIVFVILVIIVILSQVTGFGISNYGIKKALPKIVVIAILVNLSYIACELAVDVSNILGFSAETLLSSAANTVAGTGSGGGGDTASTAFSSIIGVGAAAGGIVALGVAAYSAGVVVVLLTLLMALISIVFFFVVLGLRQAGIVLLVALAPLAIVCFALPNTEKVAKRWLGMLKALLFVYPIAGVLIGGGHLAAQILLAVSSEWTFQVIAMLLFVVPFLALPSLLKKSIAGADQIFGSIVNKGEGLTGKAQGGIRNSGAMKRAQERLAAGRQNFRLGKPSTIANSIRNARAAERGVRLAQQQKLEEQNQAGHLAAYTRKDGGFDYDAAEERWKELQRAPKLSTSQQSELRALATKFATSPGKSSQLTKAIRNGTASAAFTQTLAAHASTNGDVSKAINGKDAGVNQYLAAVNAAGGDTQGGFQQYRDNYTDSNKNVVGAAGFDAEIANGLTDKELANQSVDSLSSMINSGAVNDNRITSMANNADLMSGIDADQQKVIQDQANNIQAQAAAAAETVAHAERQAQASRRSKISAAMRGQSDRRLRQIVEEGQLPGTRISEDATNAALREIHRREGS